MRIARSGLGRSACTSGLAILVGAGLGMWLTACAMRSPPAAPATGDLKQEVTALWTQIRDWRFEAGMNVEPENATKLAIRGESVATAPKKKAARAA